MRDAVKGKCYWCRGGFGKEEPIKLQHDCRFWLHPGACLGAALLQVHLIWVRGRSPIAISRYILGTDWSAGTIEAVLTCWANYTGARHRFVGVARFDRRPEDRRHLHPSDTLVQTVRTLTSGAGNGPMVQRPDGTLAASFLREPAYHWPFKAPREAVLTCDRFCSKCGLTFNSEKLHCPTCGARARYLVLTCALTESQHSERETGDKTPLEGSGVRGGTPAGLSRRTPHPTFPDWICLTCSEVFRLNSPQEPNADISCPFCTATCNAVLDLSAYPCVRVQDFTRMRREEEEKARPALPSPEEDDIPF